MMKRWGIRAALCAVCVMALAMAAQARELTALEIFARLPITLFENTPEGLSEEEKLRLIEQGASDFWEVERFDADRLTLVSRPLGKRGSCCAFSAAETGSWPPLGPREGPCAPLSCGRRTLRAALSPPHRRRTPT
ncbi:MAG: hypothetical protein V8Q84_07695 [Bilophila sp.]